MDMANARKVGKIHDVLAVCALIETNSWKISNDKEEMAVTASMLVQMQSLLTITHPMPWSRNWPP
jgi:hypothetical protein